MAWSDEGERYHLARCRGVRLCVAPTFMPQGNVLDGPIPCHLTLTWGKTQSFMASNKIVIRNAFAIKLDLEPK